MIIIAALMVTVPLFGIMSLLEDIKKELKK